MYNDVGFWYIVKILNVEALPKLGFSDPHQKSRRRKFLQDLINKRPPKIDMKMIARSQMCP